MPVLRVSRVGMGTVAVTDGQTDRERVRERAEGLVPPLFCKGVRAISDFCIFCMPAYVLNIPTNQRPSNTVERWKYWK